MIIVLSYVTRLVYMISIAVQVPSYICWVPATEM